jgi:hypothetical protein
VLMTGISRHQFVDHLVDQDRLTVACGLSLVPSRWRDDEALGPHFDDHVRHPPEDVYHFRQVLGENCGRLRLGAAKPDVLSDRVPAPAASEVGVVGDQGRSTVRGVDGQRVVRGVVEVRLGRRPALVARVEKGSAEGDGDVVVEEEPQDTPGGQPAAAWPSRTTAMSAGVSCG